MPSHAARRLGSTVGPGSKEWAADPAGEWHEPARADTRRDSVHHQGRF